MVVSGKAELDKSGWLKRVHMTDEAKLKRACSNVLDIAVLNAVVGILYTSVDIKIIKVTMYRITASVGTTGAIDVGVNGDDDWIVSARSTPAWAMDTLASCPTINSVVSAGSMVTASVETAIGTSGTIVVAIEYEEVD